MARLSGIDLPGKKRIQIALTSIYGIGLATANQILKKTSIDPNLKAEALNDQQVAKIRDEIERNIKVEGDLRKEIQLNIKRLIDLGSYRGTRHRQNLPVRGQRTHTNARTRKGRARIAIAGKKQAAAPK